MNDFNWLTTLSVKPLKTFIKEGKSRSNWIIRNVFLLAEKIGYVMHVRNIWGLKTVLLSLPEPREMDTLLLAFWKADCVQNLISIFSQQIAEGLTRTRQ